MAFVLSDVDDVLRREGWAAEPTPSLKALLKLILLVVVFSGIYGAVMGSFAAVVGERSWYEQTWQIVYSATKLPLLLLSSFLIALPAFFVVNTLLGLRGDLGEAVRALIAGQATLAIVLCSFSTITLLWYVSHGVYTVAVIFNAVMFATSTLTAQFFLKEYYRPLIQRNPMHRVLLWSWSFVYAFVGIQMAWILRPFIGDPSSEVRFFRNEVWDNAYVIVVELIWSVLMR